MIDDDDDDDSKKWFLGPRQARGQKVDEFAKDDIFSNTDSYIP